MMKTLSLITITSAALISFSATAFAASSGTSSGNSGASTTIVSPKKLNCKRNQVVVTLRGKKKCGVKKADNISDDELYNQAVSLAKDGEYEWALSLLGEIRDQNKPEVLNYTGYSHRKAGRLDTAVGYYRKALAINPNFVLAREYLGEGYAAAGFVELAKIELNEIANRCGSHCTEYQELEKAIGN